MIEAPSDDNLRPDTPIDLSGLSIVVPVRVDSEDRLRNLRIVLDYFESFFTGFEILVIEQDHTSRVGGVVEGRQGVSHVLRQSSGCFFKTRLSNLGVSLSQRPYAMVYDTDVLFHPLALKQACEMLRSDAATFVFPYNQVMLELRRDVVEQGLDITWELFGELPFCRPGERPDPAAGARFLYGDADSPCTGGALLFDRREFLLVGGYNENIISYGCEDAELYARLQALRARLGRVEGYNCYHLEHKRGRDSHYNAFDESNQRELRKVRALDEAALWAYVHNDFKSLRLDSSRPIELVNDAHEYSVTLAPSGRSVLSDYTLVLYVSESFRNPRQRLGRALTALEATAVDYEVFLFEEGAGHLRELYFRQFIVYVDASRRERGAWLEQSVSRSDRLIVALLNPALPLPLGALRRARRRFREGARVVALSRGAPEDGHLLFEREALGREATELDPSAEVAAGFTTMCRRAGIEIVVVTPTLAEVVSARVGALWAVVKKGVKRRLSASR